MLTARGRSLNLEMTMEGLLNREIVIVEARGQGNEDICRWSCHLIHSAIYFVSHLSHISHQSFGAVPLLQVMYNHTS